MAIILGLDVSTSCVGVCVLDDALTKPITVDLNVWNHQIKWLDRIEFKGCKTFWDKADHVESYLRTLETRHYITRVVLEEPLMGFRPGMSSAQTISTLMRFNGIASFVARNIFKCEPEYIGSAHARKLCGIKLQRTAVAGMSQKEQVFKYMSENDLVSFPWPNKKNGRPVDWSRDATDAYVIARAAAANGPVLPLVKKLKKVSKPKAAAGGTITS